MKKCFAVVLALALMLSGTVAVFADDAWKENTGKINLTDMTVTGAGITVSEGDIKITRGGDFTVTGKSEDAMIYINTEEKVKIRLSGMSLTNPDGPAIFFDNADKALITIEKGTENYLKDGETYKEDAKAALFSNDDMEIKGGGKLIIEALYKHGIAGDDDVVIENGIISITSKEHGVKANDLLNILNGEITVTSKEGKGLKADKEVLIEGGKITLVSEKDEGIESEGTLTVKGGTLNVTAKGDGINTGTTDNEEAALEVPAEGRFPGGKGGNMGGDAKTEEAAAASAITISGGNIYIKAEGDGIDSNGKLIISGGEVIIDGPAGGGNGSLDFARDFDITGGTVIATSSMGMVNIPGTVSQNTLKANFASGYEGGSEIIIKEGENEILKVTPSVSFRGIVFSSDKLEKGKTYTVFAGGNEEATFTVEGNLTSVGTAGGGMGGGRPEGMGGGRFLGGDKPEGMERPERPEGMGGGNHPGRNPNRISVTLDGRELFFNTDPVIKNGTTLVGFRAILEALGATVTWDGEKRMAGAEKDGIKIELYIDSVTAYVNGEEKTLLTAPEIINGSTMIPVRFVSENLGMKVSWDEAVRRVIIEK
ncbi:MAG: carbohydrate-binding domain-containing protein [Clostridia bacterium]|nr:carbohydrate-binding domain-containing protein [Clostridia bacterium]